MFVYLIKPCAIIVKFNSVCIWPFDLYWNFGEKKLNWRSAALLWNKKKLVAFFEVYNTIPDKPKSFQLSSKAQTSKIFMPKQSWHNSALSYYCHASWRTFYNDSEMSHNHQLFRRDARYLILVVCNDCFIHCWSSSFWNFDVSGFNNFVGSFIYFCVKKFSSSNMSSSIEKMVEKLLLASSRIYCLVSFKSPFPVAL